MLERPQRHGYDRERQFRGVVAAWQGDVTHSVTIVLVTAVGIALGDGDGGDEARTCQYM